MTQPLVEFAEHLRRLRKLKVSLPARHVSPEPFHDLRQATPARATRQLSDALPVGFLRLVGNSRTPPPRFGICTRRTGAGR